MAVDRVNSDEIQPLCKYCYANVNLTLVKENMRKHKHASPFLIGGYMPGDIVREAI